VNVFQRQATISSRWRTIMPVRIIRIESYKQSNQSPDH